MRGMQSRRGISRASCSPVDVPYVVGTVGPITNMRPAARQANPSMTPHSTQDRLSGGGGLLGCGEPKMLAPASSPGVWVAEHSTFGMPSPLTAMQYIMGILGVTLHFPKRVRAGLTGSCSSDDRVRAATVIRMFPEIIHSPRSTGMRRNKKAVKHLLAGQALSLSPRT